MSHSPTSAETPLYHLLSIGQRGVGKTVFLVGSYVDLQTPGDREQPHRFWFECENSQAKQTLNNVLNYIERTGHYPPATLKLTNFDFCVKELTSEGVKTHAQICWWDTPGESCQIFNPAFLMMVTQSDGACLLLDAQLLVEKANESQALEKMLNPVTALAEIVAANHLNLPIALILTKCDLLPATPYPWQTLKRNLYSLTTLLTSLGIKFRIFYCGLPIETQEENKHLQTKQGGEPIRWLVSQLQTLPNSTNTELASNSTEPVDCSMVSTLSGLAKLRQRTWRLVLVFVTGAIAFTSTLAIEQVVESQQAPQPILPQVIQP